MDIKLPKNIFWELTYHCNEECRMCPIYGVNATGKNLLQKKELSAKQIHSILEDIAKVYCEQKPRLKLTGGEPFLRNDIFNILSYIKELNFPFGLMSNFTLVHGKKIEEFLKYKPKFLNVSIDGPNEVHNWIHRKKGSLETTLTNLQDYLTNDGVDDISFEINCVVTNWNIPYLYNMVVTCKELGLPLTIQHLSFLNYKELEEQKMEDKRLFDKEQFHLTLIGDLCDNSIKQLIDQISIIKELAEKHSIRLKFKPDLSTGKDIIDYYKGTMPYNYTCNFLEDSVRISPFGGLSPCMDYDIGSLVNNSFQDLLQSKKMINLKEKLSKNILPICKRCCKIKTKRGDQNN